MGSAKSTQLKPLQHHTKTCQLCFDKYLTKKIMSSERLGVRSSSSPAYPPHSVTHAKAEWCSEFPLVQVILLIALFVLQSMRGAFTGLQALPNNVIVICPS
jgi:hypothetical protein